MSKTTEKTEAAVKAMPAKKTRSARKSSTSALPKTFTVPAHKAEGLNEQISEIKDKQLLLFGAQAQVIKDTLIDNGVDKKDWGKYRISEDRQTILLHED